MTFSLISNDESQSTSSLVVGDLVKLKNPYRPQEFVVQYGPEWQGFTHGVVVEVTSEMQHTERGATGSPRNVSLHLYDAKGQLMIYPSYVESGLMIPSYVDFHVSELVWYKRAAETGYVPVKNPPDWGEL